MDAWDVLAFGESPVQRPEESLSLSSDDTMTFRPQQVQKSWLHAQDTVEQDKFCGIFFKSPQLVGDEVYHRYTCAEPTALT